MPAKLVVADTTITVGWVVNGDPPEQFTAELDGKPIGPIPFHHEYTFSGLTPGTFHLVGISSVYFGPPITPEGLYLTTREILTTGGASAGVPTSPDPRHRPSIMADLGVDTQAMPLEAWIHFNGSEDIRYVNFHLLEHPVAGDTPVDVPFSLDTHETTQKVRFKIYPEDIKFDRTYTLSSGVYWNPQVTDSQPDVIFHTPPDPRLSEVQSAGGVHITAIDAVEARRSKMTVGIETAKLDLTRDHHFFH